MDKKRILVCSHWLEIGGAENALIGLLEQLAQSSHQVDLYLCRHSGPLMKYIPEGINLLPEDKNASSIAVGAATAIRNKAFDVILGRIWAKMCTKMYMKHHPTKDSNVSVEYSHRYTYGFVKPVNSEVNYDLAISFLAPHYITAHHVKAKVKVAWVHTDYHSVSIDPESELPVWKQFNHIVAVSSQCAKSFSEVFPSLAERVAVIENILPEKMIAGRISEFTPQELLHSQQSTCLLSVGRFCTAKNFDNVPDICAKLLERGLDVYWYLIGFGPDETLIRQKIAEAHMEDRVIILAKKENPYPYIKACDLYVQPSRYEGKSVTVREAQMLGKPVVITRYPTSASQLEDGVDGVIVPMDNEGCADGIAKLLRDAEKMKMLSQNCAERDYSNAQEVKKVYQLMEN